MKKTILILIVILCSHFVQAQQISLSIKKSVDSLIKSEMESQKIPGVSVVVIKDGKIDYVKGYGYSNLEHKVSVKPETIFQTASVGKQFTAFAIMLLVQDGKMSLDDKLTRFFPDAPAGWDSITIKHMLNHTSGFGDYIEDFNYQVHYTEDSLYQEFKKRPLLFKAGEKQKYSNMAYATLGIIMSKVIGKFYGEFLKDRILIPLGMNTARINSEEDIVPNRAAGYRLVNGVTKNQEWVSATTNTTADGSLQLSVLDMAKWEAGLNAGKLLKKEYYDLMWAPAKLNDGTFARYGFGWAIDSSNGKRILQHNGSWQGFESTIKRYPEKKIAVIVLANLKRASTYKLATKTLQIYQPELSIASIKTIKDTEPEVTRLVTWFINNVMEKTLNADHLTPDLAKYVMDSSMQIRGSEYFKSKGKFLKPELLSRKELDNGIREYRYRLLFSKEILGFMIQVNKENKIEDFGTSE